MGSKIAEVILCFTDALSDPHTRPICQLVSSPVLGVFSYNHKNALDHDFLTNVTIHLSLESGLRLGSSILHFLLAA